MAAEEFFILIRSPFELQYGRWNVWNPSVYGGRDIVSRSGQSRGWTHVSLQTSIERCYVNEEWCLGNPRNGTEACILNARPLARLVLEENGSTFTGYEVGKFEHFDGHEPSPIRHEKSHFFSRDDLRTDFLRTSLRI